LVWDKNVVFPRKIRGKILFLQSHKPEIQIVVGGKSTRFDRWLIKNI
jgi:hypothetical protein